MDGADADVPKKTSSIMSQVTVTGLRVAVPHVHTGAGCGSQDAGMVVTVPGSPSLPSTAIWTGRKA
jgi:hypothetical protein